LNLFFIWFDFNFDFFHSFDFTWFELYLGFELRKPTLQFFSLFGDSLKKREREERNIFNMSDILSLYPFSMFGFSV
jgi:hypothetical protein